MLLSNIANRQQRVEADCLVACCQMILDYLGIRRDYEWLVKVLEATAIGTSFPNVKKLQDALGVVVEQSDNAMLSRFESILESGLPVLVTVDSDDPKHWPHYSNHAVVLVGFNADEVYINNPAIDEAPQTVDINTFLWAWSRRDYEYAVIRLTREE